MRVAITTTGCFQIGDALTISGIYETLPWTWRGPIWRRAWDWIKGRDLEWRLKVHRVVETGRDCVWIE